MPTATDFPSISILDYSLLNSHLTEHLSSACQLHHSLVVGFLYLSNHPVSQASIEFTDHCDRLHTQVICSASGSEGKDSHDPFATFLGLFTIGCWGALDHAEQFYFATKHECRLGKREIQTISGSGGLYKFTIYNTCTYISPDNLKWPDKELILGFRDVLEGYVGQLEDLSYKFSSRKLSDLVQMDSCNFTIFSHWCNIIQRLFSIQFLKKVQVINLVLDPIMMLDSSLLCISK